KDRIFAAFSDQGQVLLVLVQPYPFRVGLFGSSKLANQLLINVDQRDEFLADLDLQAASTARGDASVPTPLPATPLTPTKWRKGIAKKAKQKENPFTRSLQERKEFLMMTHDSADQSAKQLPIPSEQHLMSCVTHMSLALVSSGKRRGRPETLTTLHLCLGVVLCGLEGFQSQLKLWRRLCLEPMGPFAPVLVGDQAVYNRLARTGAGAMRAFFEQISSWMSEQVAGWHECSLAPWASQ